MTRAEIIDALKAEIEWLKLEFQQAKQYHDNSLCDYLLNTITRLYELIKEVYSA